MGRKSRVIAGFAVLGFIVPWALLGFNYFAHLMGYHPNTLVYLWLCPLSVMSLALENSSLALAALVWLIIGVGNAIIYGVAGVVVSAFVPSRELGQLKSG
jgi:hypothetical protein